MFTHMNCGAARRIQIAGWIAEPFPPHIDQATQATD